MLSRRHRELIELGQCGEELEGLALDEISRDPDNARFHDAQSKAATAQAEADRILPSQPEDEANQDDLRSMAEELGF